jgi:hypothetical protein
VQVAQPLCLVARRDDEAWRWHERFGHLHFDAVQLSKGEMVLGMPHVDQLCDTCVVTKHQASYRTKEKLELVHGGLCGLVTPATPRGRRYFHLLVDNSRYMWAVLLDTKAAAADAIKGHQATAVCGCCARTTAAKFTTAKFATYCADEGI